MSKSTSVIEINGNKYDAVTGQLVGVVEKISKHVKKPSPGSSIDGFAHRGHVVGAAQAVHRRAQRSQTLMRSAVKKPAKTHHSKVSKKSGKAREDVVDPLRFSRARNTAKSLKVSRFGHPQSNDDAHQPSVSNVLTATRNSVAKAQSAAAAPVPSMVTSASHQQLERLLDQALINANSHKQKLRRDSGNLTSWERLKLAPKWLSISAGFLVIILLAGFFAWQRVPQVAMKVAATRAGVSASVPGYVPSSFSFVGPIKYGDRSVTVRYRSDKDSAQSFELTQKASPMNSTSFAATTLPRGTQVQTSQVNGTTVYIYGTANHAAWVNHGVAYTINDSANLDSEQILRIAGSL